VGIRHLPNPITVLFKTGAKLRNPLFTSRLAFTLSRHIIAKMLSKIKSSLKRFFQPLLNIMASPAPRSLFSNGPIDITMYEHHIIASALSSSRNCLDLNSENYTAIELRIYKSKSSPFHEFLVAVITSRDSSRTILLRLERTRPRPTDRDIEGQQESSPENRAVASALQDACQESIDDRVMPQNAPPDLDDDEGNHCNGGVESNRPSQIVSTNIEPPSTWNSFTSIFQQASAGASSSSESISESIKLITGTESRDIVTMVSQYPDVRQHDLVEVFRPNGFSVVSLAILAKIVHEKHPLYSLFHRQCSNLIMRVVAKNFGEEDGPQPRERRPEEPSAWVRYQQSMYLFIKSRTGSGEHGSCDFRKTRQCYG